MSRDQSPPAFGFGKQARGTEIRKDRDLAGVGPFSYEKSFVDKNTVAKFSMGKKLESSLTNKHLCSPSPNAYNPSTTQSKFKAPEFKIGTGARGSSYDVRKATAIPAPGTYEIKSKAFE